MASTFVDRGGTFTDVVVVHDDGRVEVSKVPSDRAVVGRLAHGRLSFGTTVATNALLERRGRPTLLVVSRGFADLHVVGDQTRPCLFDPDAQPLPSLATRVAEVGGRVGPNGEELVPLDEDDLAKLDDAPEPSVAVALLESPANPSHERVVAHRLTDGSRFVSMGHALSPEVGYLSRLETTLVDAAVTPLLREAMVRDEIPPDAVAMRSDGSLCPASELRAPDAVLSGPAGGVLAVAAVARTAGFSAAVGLDMGGTSTDVCRVDVGSLPRRSGDVPVAGVRLRRPMLEVETIAAGGGSIVSVADGKLSVGPRSAGADPGPACYGRGGPPTLTDAALLAGLLDPAAFHPPLDASRVSLPASPEEVLDLARETMAQAVRRLATARGVSLHDHALVAYGGAAGQHAAPVAERLGIRTVLVHPYAGVLSAVGQALARREESAVAPLWRPLDPTPGGDGEATWRALEEAWTALRARLPALGEALYSVELRYAGTDHALEVQLPPRRRDASPADEERAAPRLDGAARAALVQGFRAAHRARFGFDRPGLELELVNARVRVRGEAPAPIPADDDPWGIGDATVAGPRLLTAPTTAIWVPSGWVARRDRGLLRLDLTRPTPPPRPTQRTPYALALWSARFQSVAQEAGEVLARLARSVNIRERRDFSVAVFDRRGALVANAPHVPVHLGAMGETVRALLTRGTPAPGQAYLSNDPAQGGSHLPDLTVVTPVAAPGEAPDAPRWYVASRAHHVDVGGVTPGSMPPRSRRLADEGLVFRGVPLLGPSGTLRDLGELLSGSREPRTVSADLEAQIACNAHAARALGELGPPALVDAWMEHLADAADAAVGEIVGRLDPGAAEDSLDGVPLRVQVRPEPEGLVVDFTGTGGPHAGNLNAPPAVTRAAVLYALRVLVGRDIPLNDGALRRVRLAIPAPSILAPPATAAVVGGNVETSQRVVDLLFRALGVRAGAQGTMNNLSLGGAWPAATGRSPRADAAHGDAGDEPQRWSLYETIGGGQGASAAGPGASGRQVHMTNTRATDPEVLERRLPVRVVRFALRRGTGGRGLHAGGDGLVRELEVTAPATAALLATRRRRGGAGLAGGGDGAAGRDAVRRAGRWEPWDGTPTDLQPGDRVRVETPGGGGWGPQEPATWTLGELRAFVAGDGVLRRARAEAQRRMRGEPGHDLDHVTRVALWTVRFGWPLGVAPRLAVAAALLHDLVDVPKNSPDRPRASALCAEAARDVLAEAGLSPEALGDVYEAIRDHSFSRGAKPQRALGWALQDADRLEAVGAIGVLRTAATGGAMGSRLFHPDDPWALGRPLQDDRFVVDHFFRKLLRLPATLNTAAGRAEALRRARRMVGFLRDLGDELGNPPPPARLVIDGEGAHGEGGPEA